MSLRRYWVAQCTFCGEDSVQIDGHGTKKVTTEMLKEWGWSFQHREVFCPRCAKDSDAQIVAELNRRKP